MKDAVDLAVSASFALLAVTMLGAAWRLVRGPSILDRILAFDVIAVAAAGGIALLSLEWKTNLFLDLLLIYTLLGFFTTTAFASYLSRSEAPEKEVAGAAADSTHER